MVRIQPGMLLVAIFKIRFASALSSDTATAMESVSALFQLVRDNAPALINNGIGVVRVESTGSGLATETNDPYPSAPASSKSGPSGGTS